MKLLHHFILLLFLTFWSTTSANDSTLVDDNIQTVVEEESFLPYYALQASSVVMLFLLSIDTTDRGTLHSIYVKPAFIAFGVACLWEFSKVAVHILLGDVEILGINEDLTTLSHVFINISVAIVAIVVAIMSAATSSIETYGSYPMKMTLFLVYFASTFVAAQYSMCSDLKCNCDYEVPWGIYIFLGGNFVIYFLFANRLTTSLTAATFNYTSSLIVASTWYRWESSLITLGLHMGALLVTLPLILVVAKQNKLGYQMQTNFNY